MMFSLEGKTALVTASTAGIGYAIAAGLAKEGARVIVNGRTDEAVIMVTSLARFFRISLSRGSNIIPIADELEHAGHYLTIQKMRYKNKFTASITADDDVRQLYTIKLIVQPILENAIYHGIRNRRGGGLITVRVWKEQAQLHVCVSDNGAGMSRERLFELRQMMAGRHEGDLSGFGLFNVDQRIKLYYAQPQGLHIESEQGQGSSISFHVPVMEKETHRV